MKEKERVGSEPLSLLLASVAEVRGASEGKPGSRLQLSNPLSFARQAISVALSDGSLLSWGAPSPCQAILGGTGTLECSGEEGR